MNEGKVGARTEKDGGLGRVKGEDGVVHMSGSIQSDHHLLLDK